MATFDIRRGGTTGYLVQRPTLRVVERRFKVLATASSASGDVTAVSASDIVQVLNIPAKTFLVDLRVEVVQVGTGNISVGDNASATTFVSAQAISATGFIGTMAATSKFYSSADVIKVTFASGNDGTSSNQTPILAITAVLADHNSYPAAGVASL